MGNRMQRPGFSRRDILWLAAGAIFFALASWLTVSASLAAYYYGANSDRALSIAPWDARAKAAKAEDLLRDGMSDRKLVSRATDLAREAIERDPTIANAWRSLAATSELGDKKENGSKLIAFAERISRRDLPTQLWLIEEEVGKGNIAGALKHYDIAMRTHPESASLLLPILISASSDDEISEQLGRLLGTSPAWSETFYYQLSQNPPQGRAVVNLLRSARRHGSFPKTDTLPYLIPLLVERGEYEPAAQVFQILGGHPLPKPKGVLNGDFERQIRFAPFDWQLIAEDGAGAEERSGIQDAPGTALVAFTGGQDKVVARQLLMLGAGDHRLRYRTGHTEAPAAQLSWHVSCAPSGTALGEQKIPASVNPGPGELTFRVPASGCAVQWLSLEVQVEDPQMSEAWIDKVDVVPANMR